MNKINNNNNNNNKVMDPMIKEKLDELKETINLCNPVYLGHMNDWKTSNQLNLEKDKKEDKHIQSLIYRECSLLGTPIAKDEEIKRIINEETYDNQSKTNKSTLLYGSNINMLKNNKIPSAKRTHMSGILHDIPGSSECTISTSNETLLYTKEMKQMNKEKDMHYFRKRDKYSEYVEARARFSKMHHVN